MSVSSEYASCPRTSSAFTLFILRLQWFDPELLALLASRAVVTNQPSGCVARVAPVVVFPIDRAARDVNADALRALIAHGSHPARHHAMVGRDSRPPCRTLCIPTGSSPQFRLSLQDRRTNPRRISSRDPRQVFRWRSPTCKARSFPCPPLLGLPCSVGYCVTHQGVFRCIAVTRLFIITSSPPQPRQRRRDGGLL